MPYDLFKKWNLGEPKPCNTHVQLANKSIVHPRGIIENILLKVNDFIFLFDFVILHMMRFDIDTPLTLGRPFLATSKAIINVHEGKITLRIDSAVVKIKGAKL